MFKYLLLLFLSVGLCGAQLAGGISDIEITDEVQNLTWYAVNEGENKASNSLYHWIPVKIVSAKSQVVSGMMYYLEVEMAQSTCTKNQMSHTEVSAEKCSEKPDAQRQTCTFEIWQQVWRDFEQIEKKDCSGGEEKKNTTTSSPELQIKSKWRLRKKHRHLLGHNLGAWNLFRGFMQKYNRTYPGGNRETMQRYRIYKKNLRIIKKMQENEKGSAQYGVTQFADMTPHEFRTKILTPEWYDTGYPTKVAQVDLQSIGKLPRNFDWRHQNVVTEVKNQGNCGSCWAFSVTGNIEGQWAIHKKKLVSLSEQELVDCDKVDDGCSGGLPSNAYKELLRLGGLEKEADYPYEGKNDKCQLEKKEIAVYINDSIKLPQNEAQMAAWLFKNGPISIGINANAMMFYWGGISWPWRILCNPKNLNHGVLIVGYGVKGTEPYWIIKNSWGPGWGEDGYYRIYRGKGVCGVDQMATSAIVE